jgi:hypothetical protein
MADVKKNAHAEQIDYAGTDDKDNTTARQASLFEEEILKQKKELGDYSGAKEKTDPAEIALVKKLDRWIMPMLVYIKQRSKADADLALKAMAYVLAQLPRP